LIFFGAAVVLFEAEMERLFEELLFLVDLGLIDSFLVVALLARELALEADFLFAAVLVVLFFGAAFFVFELVLLDDFFLEAERFLVLAPFLVAFLAVWFLVPLWPLEFAVELDDLRVDSVRSVRAII